MCSCVPLATACLSSLCPTPGQRRLLPRLLRPSLQFVFSDSGVCGGQVERRRAGGCVGG